MTLSNKYSEGMSSFNLFDEIELKENYSSTRYNVGKEQYGKKSVVDPFINLIVEEVSTLTKKKREKFFNLLRVISATMIPLASTKNASAQMIQTSAQKINIPFVEGKEGLGIIPPEIFDILTQLIGGAMKLGSLVAILLLIIAGGYKMAGQSDKAKKWITEILKGLGIILLAPAVIILLVAITSLALSGIDGLDIFY